MTKILIIRFSSIGDIVLTTPVIRCIKQQLPNVELHYASKKSFKTILENNPYIDKLHLLEGDLLPFVKELKAEKFDIIIDLHNNLRTRMIKLMLGTKSASFHKLNIQKFIFTQFKKNYLPNIHIVDRYLETAKILNISNDGKGLDYFIPTKDEVDISTLGLKSDYIGFVIGAKFATKRMPLHKIVEVCKLLKGQVVFMGGPEDKEMGNLLLKELNDSRFINSCGSFNLNQSASLVKQADKIITHDTGLMHIASAFQKEIVSIWGNTVPDFGMYPYLPKDKFTIVEVKNLDCRPCSKIGYDKCPKGHFNCMNLIEPTEIIKALK